MKRSSHAPASLIAACAAASTLALSPASRADAPDSIDGGNSAEHWSLGLGLVVQQHPYAGVGTRILPFPFVSYRNANFYVEGLSAGYIVWHGRGMSLAITLSPRLGGYKASDSPALSGMANRNFTLDGGVAATLHRRWGMLRLSGRSDLLGVYNGQILDLRYGMPLPDVRPTGPARRPISISSSASSRPPSITGACSRARAWKRSPRRSPAAPSSPSTTA